MKHPVTLVTGFKHGLIVKLWGQLQLQARLLTNKSYWVQCWDLLSSNVFRIAFLICVTTTTTILYQVIVSCILQSDSLHCYILLHSHYVCSPQTASQKCIDFGSHFTRERWLAVFWRAVCEYHMITWWEKETVLNNTQTYPNLYQNN